MRTSVCVCMCVQNCGASMSQMFGTAKFCIHPHKLLRKSVRTDWVHGSKGLSKGMQRGGHFVFILFYIEGCCEVQSPFQFDFQFKGCANCIGFGVCFLPSSCPMNGMGWNTSVRRTVTLSNSHSFEIQDRSWMNHIQTGLLSKSPSLLGFGPPVQTVFAHPFMDWAWLGHLCHLMNTANMSIVYRQKTHFSSV